MKKADAYCRVGTGQALFRALYIPYFTAILFLSHFKDEEIEAQRG